MFACQIELDSSLEWKTFIVCIQKEPLYLRDVIIIYVHLREKKTQEVPPYQYIMEYKDSSAKTNPNWTPNCVSAEQWRSLGDPLLNFIMSVLILLQRFEIFVMNSP